MRGILIAVTLTIVCRPAVALADSDYYYCTEPGYIAYETRLGQTPAGHRLHIVQFSSARGIVELAAIPIEDFQVHAMRCRASVVELEGWTTGYDVDFSNPGRPMVTARPTTFAPTQPASQVNLGHWAKAGVINLDADGPPGVFQLVIARVSHPLSGGVEHYTVSELVRRNRESGLPELLESVRLFQGVFLETVH